MNDAIKGAAPAQHDFYRLVYGSPWNRSIEPRRRVLRACAAGVTPEIENDIYLRVSWAVGGQTGAVGYAVQGEMDGEPI